MTNDVNFFFCYFIVFCFCLRFFGVYFYTDKTARKKKQNGKEKQNQTNGNVGDSNK